MSRSARLLFSSVARSLGSALPILWLFALLAPALWSGTYRVPEGREAFAAQNIPVSLEDLGHDRYRVTGNFLVASSSATAWEVLADYDHIDRFVFSLRSSIVRQRQGNQVVLEQEARGKFLFFSRDIYILLSVTEDPPRSMSFRDTSGKSFSFYEGSWKLEVFPDKTQIFYTLEAKPRFMTVNFLTKRIIKKQIYNLLEQVQAEIARRAEKLSVKE